MTSAKRPRPASPRKKRLSADYLHGYSRAEQDRLYRQAALLEAIVYPQVDLSGVQRLLEVGCGVGAQTEILLRRFPTLTVQGVDASPAQLARARTRLRAALKQGRARFDVRDAAQLGYPDDSFDAAFVCWFLEHVAKPVPVLREIRRTLKRGARIYCTEVMNASLFVHPYSPATLQFHLEFNDQQWMQGGDPFVGAKLGNYLLEAGYRDIQTHTLVQHFDNREPKRRAVFIDETAQVLMSAAPALLAAKRVTRELVAQMQTELRALQEDPNAVLFYVLMQAQAVAL